MKLSLRQVLADSHIAAVTIAVLLLWSLNDGFHALWEPLSRVVVFLFTAVAIFDIPYFSSKLTRLDSLSLLTVGAYLYWASVNFFVAWLLAHWVYGAGPVKTLSTYSRNSRGRNDV